MFITQPDSYYYGAISDTTTLEELEGLMARGLEKWLACHGSEDFNAGEILDRWFEHDANHENKFDHKVPEPEFEAFIDRTVGRLST